MSKILFVVHRYAPFPGGSEYYVRDMAEEMVKRGHDVTVLAHEHQGDLNRVRVTNDYNILNQKWLMIIVHGCDVISQNVVLANAAVIRSPICYMIIKPSFSLTAQHGMKYAKYLAYSTSMDLEHIKAMLITDSAILQKARRIRHGIVPESTIGVIPKDWQVDRPYYVSAGGFSPHKGMDALADYWAKATEVELVLFGYQEGNMPSYPNVKSWIGLPKESVMTAIAASKGYILNSYEEGFGLVLLEAMLNKVPCYARNIAGAKDMKPYVMTYETEEELFPLINAYEALTDAEKTAIIERNYNYVMSNHTITQTCNDLEDILAEERIRE